MRRDRAGGRRAGESGSGWDSGLRSLAVHAAIVGLAGVFVLAALLLAALAGLATATAQPTATAPAAAVRSALAAARAASAPREWPGCHRLSTAACAPATSRPMSGSAPPTAGSPLWFRRISVDPRSERPGRPRTVAG
jgi:hypothetical protein